MQRGPFQKHRVGFIKDVSGYAISEIDIDQEIFESRCGCPVSAGFQRIGHLRRAHLDGVDSAREIGLAECVVFGAGDQQGRIIIGQQIKRQVRRVIGQIL